MTNISDPESPSQPLNDCSDTDDESIKPIYQAAREGKNFIIIGPGGCGKSVILNNIRNKSKNPLKIAISAPTGIAAINAGGITLHSLFGYHRSGWLGIPIDESLRGKKIKDIKLQKWAEIQLIYIQSLDMILFDEFSMINSADFRIMDIICQVAKENLRPFGGIQIGIAGDPFQLNPVGGKPCWTNKTLWESLSFSEFYLVPEILPRYIDLLTSDLTRFLRLGISSPLVSKLIQYNKDKERPNLSTRLFYGNKEVVDYNKSIYDNIKEKEYDYPSKMTKVIQKSTGDSLFPFKKLSAHEIQELPSQIRDWISKQEEYYRELLQQTNNVDNEGKGTVLKLKPKCNIICIANYREDRELKRANGTAFVIEECRPDSILVKSDNGQTQVIHYQTMIRDVSFKKGNDQYRMTLITNTLPVKLAYSMTIHKSQSLSLPGVIISGKGFISKPGLLYVALSRSRSREGIYLDDNLDLKKIRSCPLALEQFKDHYSQELTRLIKIHPDWFENYTVVSDSKEHKILKQKIEQSIPRINIVEARIGQQALKNFLMENHKICLITCENLPDLLEAAHIKPYCTFSQGEDAHRGNGILLSKEYHCLFDKGYWTLDENGNVILSRWAKSQKRLAFPDKVKIPPDVDVLNFAWHRENVFIRDK